MKKRPRKPTRRGSERTSPNARRTESPLELDACESLLTCADEAVAVLHIDEALDPEAIVAAIDQALVQLQVGGSSTRDDDMDVELDAGLGDGTADDDQEQFDPSEPELSELDNEEVALLLASLWGEQLVRQFGWEWGSMIFHDHGNTTAVGVFSPDRSLAIYPFHFIFRCLEEDAPVTLLLAFQILKDASRIPALPEGGYENVMDNVHHVDEAE